MIVEDDDENDTFFKMIVSLLNSNYSKPKDPKPFLEKLIAENDDPRNDRIYL